MKFAITMCVPSYSRQFANWGDVYFAESMQAELLKMGHDCQIHGMDTWNQLPKNDTHIHLRGLHKYPYPKVKNAYAWIINHPELIDCDSLKDYRLCFCASKPFTEILNQNGIDTIYLPQAGDSTHFYPIQGIKKEFDVLFVGNNHQAQNKRGRKLVEYLLTMKDDVNYKIVGAAWKGLVPDKHILCEFVEWKDLNRLYQSAKIVLNDHQDTMRDYSFINNRTFDLAMAQQFQICDEIPELEELGIVTCRSAVDLQEKISLYLLQDDLISRNNKIVSKLCKEFSFAERMKHIVRLVKEKNV
ncbi:MAG: glycosyltransferase family 1 protein [Candidatus Cloacimonetes bacterium]|nr:glycosyltransferase family 1 protein [Candidatus Cloacimonadota bacterium]